MVKREEEMPLQKGTTHTGANRQRVHGVVDVRTVLIDYTDVSGNRETLMAQVAGNNVVIVENKGRPAQAWLRDIILEKLKNAGGVEQG